jgi:site-specific DNA-methyltransferase (adenine-specific)
MRSPALFSSAESDWATPAELCAAIVRAFGCIALDPCAARHSAIVANVRYFVRGVDRPWPARGLVYCNPPYGRALSSWADACARHARAGGEVLALVPARTDTRWFATLTPEGVTVCLVRGRLRFERPGGARESAPFPSALVYFGQRPRAFARLAAGLGPLWVPAPLRLASRGKSRGRSSRVVAAVPKRVELRAC